MPFNINGTIAQRLDANLICDPDTTWMHPTGEFVLAPSYGLARRMRLSAKGKPMEEVRICAHCRSHFTPTDAKHRFCKPTCYTRSRGR